MMKEITYKGILKKVVCIFMVLYLIMMGLLTGIQREAYKREYSAQMMRLYDRLEYQSIETINDYERAQMPDAEKGYDTSYSNIETGLYTDIRMFSDAFSGEGMYSKFILLDEQENILAESGNIIKFGQHIEDEDGDRWSTRAWSEYSYLQLEKYFSTEEILEIFQLFNTATELIHYNFSVDGYRKGGEIIPKTVSIYKEEYEEFNNADTYSAKEGRFTKTDTTYEQDATDTPVYIIIEKELIKTYTFEVEVVEDMEPYQSDWSQPYFEALIKSRYWNDELIRVMNNKIIENYQRVENLLVDTMQSLPSDGGIKMDSINEINTIGQVLIKEIDINDEIYYIAFAGLYYPLELTIQQLLPFYVGCLIMFGGMAVILAKGIWKNYEKEQLIEKSRRKLIDAIGHELKTPLGIIRTYSECLKEGIAKDKADYYLDVVMDEVDQMNELVIDMLDLSKLESKAYTLKEEEFDLIGLVNEVVKEAHPLLSQSNKFVEVTYDKNYMIKGDYKRIKQVISNLLINGIIHTGDSQSVKIEVKKDILKVENNGPCISEEEISSIWEAFYTTQQSNQKAIIRGTGLGLSIVKHVLELHQIPFGVRNKEDGVVFWIDFSMRVV